MAGYHRMLGDAQSELKQPFLPTNNRIPDYFTEDDVIRIFAACPQPQASSYATNPLLRLPEGIGTM
jgi:hypothetical protein